MLGQKQKQQLKQKLSSKVGVNEYLTQLSASDLGQMSKWGFLKNVININTFFATSKDVKQAAKAGIKVDATGTKTGKQDKSEEKSDSKEKEDSADKTDSEEGDLFNKQKKTKVSKQK
jgi:hypothetical protein